MDATSNLAVGTSAFAITPSDSTNFTKRARAIYVGVGGDVTVVNADGTTCLFKDAPSGMLLLTECKRINATGTLATNLVGLV